MRHLISQPHIIFSVENSPYPDKVEAPFSHDDAVQFLKQFQGGKIYSMGGHYGKPEKSILITDPSDDQKEAARALAHMTGQESHIESDGYTHKMIYNHGPNSGKVVMGQGTEFHQAKPKDMYSVLPDGSTFTHNFDFGEPFEKARVDEGKSPEEKRSARAERQSSWEKENYGMMSGASKNREIAGFMHRAKLHQIRNSPIPKLPKSEMSKANYETLMKPYASEAQRRWAHTPAGIKTLGGKKAVEHWDKESKGKDLPEKIEKALPLEELQAQGYKFRYHGRNPGYHVIQVFKDRKKVGHLAYSKDSVSNDFSKDFGYHRVKVGHIEPEHQGKGLYQNMLNMAKDHVKSLGSKGIMSEGYQRSKAATRAWDKVATHADPHTSNASVRGRLSPEDSDYYLAASEMEKGLKGDWKKEGYTLKFHPPKVEMFNGKHDITSHRVTAHDPKGNRVGDYYFSEWPEASEHKGLLHVTFSGTDPDHQRKGLASAAYSVIEQKTGKKVHSSVGNRSADAKKLWSQPNRPFGKSNLEKGSIANLAAAGIIGLTSTPAIVPETTAPREISQAVPKTQDFHTKMLQTISQVESSGGRNVAHAKLPSDGIHRGTRAFGKYGLTPVLIQETVRRNKKLLEKHPKLSSMDLNQINSYMKKNPELEHEIASSHLNRLRQHFGDDPAKIGYAWLQGITGTKKAINEKKPIQDHWHVKKILNSYEKSEGTDSSLQKMSRPRITFPNLKEISTRPDQDIQEVGTERQKKLFARKVAATNIPDSKNVRRTQAIQKPDGSLEFKDLPPGTIDRQSDRDSAAKRVSRGLSGVLGIVHHTKRGPMGAVLTGQMYQSDKRQPKSSGHGPEYEAKLKQHFDKRNQMVRDYNSATAEWRKKGMELSNDPSKYTEFQEHMAKKPEKPKLPRKPAAPRKKTQIEPKLSREDMAARGRSIAATTEHEGLHYLIDKVGGSYGKVAAKKVLNKLLDSHDPEALSHLAGFLTTKMRYKRNDPSFGEELIAHARDILVNPRKRESFKNFIGDKDKADKVISALKTGHQKAYKVAQSIKPEDITTSMENQQMTASEEMKKGAARRIFGGINASNLPGRDKANEWQESLGFMQERDSNYDEETHQAARRDIPRMEEGLRLRALNKLSNRTLTRKHPETGKRQFLLFRGVGPNERQAVLDGAFVRHDDHSSWTPHIGTAKGFEGDYNTEDGPAKTIAAWVDEDSVHSAPHMYGNMPGLQMDMDNAGEFYTPGKNKPGKNQFTHEHEIIVAPHTSDRATKGDVKRYHAIHTRTRTKMAQTDPKKDLHGRINYRGEWDSSGFRSTKQYPLMRDTKPLPSAVKDIMRTMKAPKKMAASEEENE
jgi:GNAT superfamily N-acetyltransferase